MFVTLENVGVSRIKEPHFLSKIFNYVKGTDAKRNVVWIANKTIEATGISRASILKIRAEDARDVMVQ
jgi:hypothetical protein